MGRALVGGVATEFVPTHREQNETPILMNLGMVVPVSAEDLVAAMWDGTTYMSQDELADTLTDTAYLRQLVVENLFALGGNGVEAARIALAAVEPGSWDAQRADMIRPAVTELAAAHSAARRARSTLRVPHPRTTPEVTR
ncbi:hypothetical protein ATK36_3772 [Amycolatopsis sulphurea]|uniref:Uncharacterized protein n=2 Tax=Amycolatopsis sulphurea TaxID=76022 RepID=A0A2A9FDU8_9PSEU|nr:hypothetical protein ATK36_3772 [Amycolatopsis sulphurea]